MKNLTALLVLSAILFTSGRVAAQAPAPPVESCEDRLGTLGVWVNQLATSRVRQEQEAAQTIARLMREVEGLRTKLVEATKPAK